MLLTETQLKVLGFTNNKVWDNNRVMLGHKDGESFEEFFKRKHGYQSHLHEEEIKKRKLTEIEIINNKLENLIKSVEERKIAVDSEFEKQFKFINRLSDLDKKQINFQAEKLIEFMKRLEKLEKT